MPSIFLRPVRWRECLVVERISRTVMAGGARRERRASPAVAYGA
jgi:hypothetical protein